MPLIRDEGLLTASYVRERLSYDAATGALTWRRTTLKPWLVGKEAGSISSAGYRVINFGRVGGNRPVMAHRVIWLHLYGRWPNGEVDHINANRSDNRLCNLRDATRLQNASNCPARGFTVTKHGRYVAQIRHAGHNHYIGTFTTPEEASAAYAAKAEQLRGEFMRRA